MNRLTLQTKRLTLRPLVMSDAPDVHRLVGAIEIARNTLRIPHPYPDGAAEQWIGMHQNELKETDEVVFAIVVRETSEFAGVIGLEPKHFDIAEIGYWIGVPYWGRGYASEAARAVIEYGFEQRGFNRIEAGHFVRNPASGRVMEKAGMKYEGLLRQAMKKGDEYLDVKMYSILRSEFQR